MYKIDSRLVVAIALMISSVLVRAQQTTDSLKQKATQNIKEKFPRSRLLNFEYGQSLSRDFNSELFDEAFQDGKIKAQHSFRAAANIPVYSTRKWTLTASINYLYNEFEFSAIDNNQIDAFEINSKEHFHNFSTAASATYFSFLFKKPVLFNASIIADGNENGFQRIKGLMGISFVMKKTERTTITLGAIVFIDPTSQLPFFPTFSYNHKFKDSKWEIDFILPQRLLFRRFVGENARFSIGSSFGSNGFYVPIDRPGFAEIYEYSQLEIKSGIIYEHRLSDYFITTLQAGLQNFISNRLTERGQPNSDFIYENTQNGTGYFQIGLSIDPFAKK